MASKFTVDDVKKALAKASSPKDYPPSEAVDDLFLSVREELAQLLKRRDELQAESRLFRDRLVLLKKTVPSGASGKKEYTDLRLQENEIMELRASVPAKRKDAYEAEAKRDEAERLKREFLQRSEMENQQALLQLQKEMHAIEQETERLTKEFEIRSGKRQAEIKRLESLKKGST